MSMTLHKDEALDRLATIGNVAQFVAFRPDGSRKIRQSTSRVAGMPPNAPFSDPGHAAAALLAASAERAVNVRSYLPDDPRSREFVYGIGTVDEAVGHLRRLAAEGLHLILNETVDVGDGGVSGVAQGDVIEFAPDDTPRAVEKPGTASLPRDMGLAILTRVYGFPPDIPGRHADRVEFSIHPGPRGWRRTRTLLWEIEEAAGSRTSRPPAWPNRFSRHIGDKVFGLLVADALEAPVPATTVVSRRIAPFTFGRATGGGEIWIRTAPREPQPGLFTTAKGWRDPFALLAAEDVDGQIAAVLAQAGVEAEWSGAALVGSDDRVVVEGRSGEGDALMLGLAAPEPLPTKVLTSVERLHRNLSDALGPVRLEWVYDGSTAWVVQLHLGATRSAGDAVVEGEALRWVEFDGLRGLAELRDFLETIEPTTGVKLLGDIGLTSHMADLLRRRDGPSRIAR